MYNFDETVNPKNNGKHRAKNVSSVIGEGKSQITCTCMCNWCSTSTFCNF